MKIFSIHHEIENWVQYTDTFWKGSLIWLFSDDFLLSMCLDSFFFSLPVVMFFIAFYRFLLLVSLLYISTIIGWIFFNSQSSHELDTRLLEILTVFILAQNFHPRVEMNRLWSHWIGTDKSNAWVSLRIYSSFNSLSSHYWFHDTILIILMRILSIDTFISSRWSNISMMYFCLWWWNICPSILFESNDIRSIHRFLSSPPPL